MNYLQLQDYCLGLPHVSQDMPFGDDVIAYRIGGSIFALLSLKADPPSINLKCDPDLAIKLRERYDGIIPGYHMNKKHWNTVYIEGVSRVLVEDLIKHSYRLVATKLPKAKRDEHAPIQKLAVIDWGKYML